MKTAISVDDTLLENIDQAARDLGVSRSKLFALAAEDFLELLKRQQMVEQLNQVYDGSQDPMTPKIKASMRKVIKDRW
ncbi:MAG: CopG family transcriptional regulator [Acidobacteriota bacterium]